MAIRLGGPRHFGIYHRLFDRFQAVSDFGMVGSEGQPTSSPLVFVSLGLTYVEFTNSTV
jgi:hypothetical protein